jgi:prepilin-type N-terminal cleavage/methylation domain-containing protein
MKNSRGFSLIELLVVVVIIGVIMAFAVPGLLRARQYAQAGSAIQSLRTVTTAEVLYQRRFKKFGTLTELATEGTVDGNIGSGQKSAYNFILTLIDGPLDPSVTPPSGPAVEHHFSCTAEPLIDQSRTRFFYVDDTGVIRSNSGAPADINSPAIPD